MYLSSIPVKNETGMRRMGFKHPKTTGISKEGSKYI
jgi:hypothetical protein